MKLCKDCEWYEPSKTINPKHSHCIRPTGGKADDLDLVTGGKPGVIYCDTERLGLISSSCGKEGKYFTHKDFVLELKKAIDEEENDEEENKDKFFRCNGNWMEVKMRMLWIKLKEFKDVYMLKEVTDQLNEIINND